MKDPVSNPAPLPPLMREHQGDMYHSVQQQEHQNSDRRGCGESARVEYELFGECEM